jgi:hypothetical protein
VKKLAILLAALISTAAHAAEPMTVTTQTGQTYTVDWCALTAKLAMEITQDRDKGFPAVMARAKAVKSGQAWLKNVLPILPPDKVSKAVSAESVGPMVTEIYSDEMRGEAPEGISAFFLASCGKM